MEETIEQKQAPTDMSAYTKKAYILIFMTLIIFFSWATLTQLNSGAIASGEIIPSGKVLTIQHKDGGIIQNIMVHDGQSVQKGDVLVEVEDISAKSELQMGMIDKNSLESLMQRLEAERDEKEIVLDKDIDSDSNVYAEYQLFKARKNVLEKDKEILEQRIKQIQNEIKGYRVEINSLETILESEEETLRVNQELYKNRYIDKRKLLESQNSVANIEGNIGKTISLIATSNQKIEETKTQITRLKTQWKNDVLEQLKSAKDNLDITNEKIIILKDRLQRSKIKAPTNGIVHGLQFNTIGGVIKPSQEIMQIIPENENLIVEAKLMPDDIDAVHVGLKAYVRISAFLQRAYNAVEGTVTHISPNTFKDEYTDSSFYKVKIEIPKEKLNELGEIELQVGMLAQVEIVTGERTPLQYLTQPFIDSFHKSFKEE